jgi:iron complex outermembrane receptor protein
MLLLLLFFVLSPLAAQTGTITGTVRMSSSGEVLHGATITVSRAGRSVETGEDGRYEITGLAPGTYSVMVHLQSLGDQTAEVTVTAGASATLDFSLRLSPMKVSMTVTANEKEQLTFESFQSVTSLDSIDLAMKSKSSLGEILDHQPGVAKRSFGPGSSRPVIRGFDGDRVLVMQDGLPTGALSSQSGDHGESMDASSLDRLEVVKGPATLLYGANAIGGVVNALTGHHVGHEHPHRGARGFITGNGGSANGQAGASGGFDLGLGAWQLWGSGSAQRSGDYHTAAGQIENSATRLSNSSGGLAWHGAKTFFDVGYRHEEGRYGVPFAGGADGGESGEEVDLGFRRHNLRMGTGWKSVDSVLPEFRLTLNYGDWEHKELEGEDVGTVFRNKQFTWRGVFQQRERGRLSGSFGFQGSQRNYKATGEEALTPPVDQNNFAVFALEELAFEKFRLQFGGRADDTRYDPLGLRKRSFTGVSGAGGIYLPVWKGGAFVTNFTSSFRAPALEELYNNGPHIGNLTFETGNTNLKRERSNGIDAGLRHSGARLRGELNFFYYGIGNFVYLAPTGEVEDGLPAGEYEQAASRFTGAEAGLDVALRESLWLNFGADYVNAKLKEGGHLPRIPPLRGRVGIEYRKSGFTLRPELRMAMDQNNTFLNETRTPGYTVFNCNATYTVAQQHAAHIFGVEVFNLGDRLYRNHLSFIKERAPEIGRGVRFVYTVRFF